MKLEPDKQFKVTVDAVVAILAKYGLVLYRYSLATSGIENTTIIVETDVKKVVVRIYRLEKKPLSEIELEINFMNYLNLNGILVPRIIYNNKKSFLTKLIWDKKTWQVVVFDFVDGEQALEYNSGLIIDISHWQARMHLISEQYNYPDNSPKLNKVLYEDNFLSLIDLGTITNNRILSFLKRSKNYRVTLSEELPSGLCHLDYDKDNIICDKNKVKSILDFDDVAVAPYVLCLGYTLWHIWRYGGKEMADLYLKKYELYRPLNALEKSFIKSVILFRHYMISDLNILNGHTSSGDAEQYIKLEHEILSGL